MRCDSDGNVFIYYFHFITFGFIVRIGSLPQKSGLNDEYSHAMKKNATECSEHFGIECRYSILGFLLNNQLKAAQ